MFAEERRNAIIQMLQSGQKVKVAELCRRLQVSEATVRRDLQELRTLGLIHRTHGGALSPQHPLERSFQDREVQQLAEKQAIAAHAAALVEDGETILLDAGTTTLEIARALRGRAVTVATNSMDVASIFTDDTTVDVILLGGSWRKSINSLVGPLTNQQLRTLHFDKCFLGANAVDVVSGVATHNLLEAETKQHMIAAAATTILVADHTKFGCQDFARICGLEELSLLISDKQLAAEQVSELEAYLDVQLAGKE